MKKLIAVMAVLFSVNAGAWTGTGNDRINGARDYIRFLNGDTTNLDYAEVRNWQGTVAGLSSVFDETAYRHSICYPEKANLQQLAEIAANYLIDHPEDRAMDLNPLVWKSHLDAFGRQSDESCWRNATE